ncbi:hypothetical protein [Paenibacillus durus]|uniref:Uncharacterized protein n=1 Tax=Paenibacillus durus TaxID=44251 RepID=A0A089IQL3_PAEDU|nr:hypothetical protein [Paenibacillus durus]AIQ11329.1 hypothetical protein PDUR_04470 [Paenibacillus durus]
MEQPTQKQIYQHIPYAKKKEINGQYSEFVFSLDINSYKIDDLVVDNEEVNRLATDISNHFIATFQQSYEKDVSEKQKQFSYDCARLIFSELKQPDKTTVIPAKAGFGKSTLILSILETVINSLGAFRENESAVDLGMIIVSDRIEDLKKTQSKIRERFGYYDTFNQEDWVYVMEGWNKEKCENGVVEYYSGCCTTSNCSLYKDCWVYKQRFEQNDSPIVAMTNERFSYYRTEKMDTLNSYNTFHGTLPRKIIIIDEKPVLEKHVTVDETILLILSEAINNINVRDPIEDSNNKMYLKNVLHEIHGRLLELQKKHAIHRSRIILNDEDIFDEKFLQTFSRYFKYQFTEEITAIQLLFKSGGLFCHTSKRTFFKAIFPKEKFQIENFRTYIFDATGEGDPSYTDEFIHFNIDDYKEYSNLTFYINLENMSRNSIESSRNKLDIAARWINNKFQEATYVVSYKTCGKMNASQRLTKLLKSNKHVVLDKDKNGKNVVPYFGNTKGKNLFQNCRNMVQIGWPRLPSDETVAAYMYTFVNMEKLKQLSESEMDQVQGYIKFNPTSSKFGLDNINIFELKRMMVDLEQEVFRTKVRDFSSNEPVNIYLFGGDYRIKEMIAQRFKGCKFRVEEIPEFALEKNKQNGEDKKEKKLYNFINENWDGQPILLKQLRDDFKITETYWSKLMKKKLIKNLFEARGIKASKLKGKGKDKYLHRIIDS